MGSPDGIRREIRRRLKGYLVRDRTGIRRELLGLFVRLRSLTIPRIYEVLTRRFRVSYHALASMVGIIAARIGILHVRKPLDSHYAVYELREEYADVVTQLLVA
ncbi:MAG TPA: DUF2551 domain-containing protein [Methanomicrobiales archaeon]|nr:DUF2551 domain-containing protein [Methanomicrobiales archaeon]